jgi:hypothetical protein
MKALIPKPNVMPIDRVEWFNKLNLSNFINSYYQFRDVYECGKVKDILIIGPGQGLDTQILKWRGYTVTTFDIDDTFKPDFLGSVHDLSMFKNLQFDVVIASHVLEHIAVPYLDLSLKELSRVARWSIIYLPIAGKHCHLRFIPGIKGIDLSFIFDFYNLFDKPDGVTPKYCGGQHFWEVGLRGFRKKDLIKRFDINFTVVKHYRNQDWNSSYNFILRSNYC